MARIRSFAKSDQRVDRHPTEVDCEHVMVGTGADRLLHLGTFGSDDRVSKRKSSQSIQLDLCAARELVRIIESAFPDLRRP